MTSKFWRCEACGISMLVDLYYCDACYRVTLESLLADPEWSRVRGVEAEWMRAELDRLRALDPPEAVAS